MTIKLPESALLDSSVILKWFRRNETWREVALQLRQTYLDGHMLIYIPDLLIYDEFVKSKFSPPPAGGD